MLDRILGNTRSRPLRGDRVYGSRHDRVGRHTGVQRVADMIRQDIALARSVARHGSEFGGPAVGDPVGDAPTEITFDVYTRDSNSIVITIKDVPLQWGWVTEMGVSVVSDALRALAHELADIMNAYNHDGSDIEKRFFGWVRTESEILSW